MLKATIVYIVDPVTHEVLMAKKTRKVGVGYWFGYGGKIEEGETAEACTVREVEEETGGVIIDEATLERVALIDFYRGAELKPFVDEPTFRVLCYRLFLDKSTINPVTTEQMADPTWFPVDNLPHAEMKPGDELFVPQIIAGTLIKGWVHFSDDAKTVLASTIEPCTITELTL